MQRKPAFWQDDFATFRHWIVYQPKAAIAVSVAILCFALLGWLNFATTSDYRVYFGEDNPQLAAFDHYEQQFEQAETLLVVLEATQGSLFEPEKLQALRFATNEVLLLPYARRAVSLANHHHTWAEGDNIFVEPLLPKGEITEAMASRAHDIAFSTAELPNRLISADGTIGLVAVQTPLPRLDLNQEVPEVANAARKLEAEIEAKFTDIEVHLSGIVMLNDAMKQTTTWDISRLFPAMFMLIFIGQLLFFRRLAASMFTTVIYFLAAVSAYGMSGWMGLTLNAASMAAGLVVIVLSVADCIHILVSYYQELDYQKKSREAAMLESLRINLQPVFITSITTVIGFLGLSFSDSPPFRHLGYVVAVGVVFAFLFSVILLPSLLMLVSTTSRNKAQRDNVSPFMDRFAGLVIRLRWPLLVVMSAAVVMTGLGIKENKFGDDYSKYFDESLDFRRSTDFINDRLAGMQALEYIITSDHAGGVNDPEFLHELEAFKTYLENPSNIPETRKALSIVDLHKRLNRTMHGDDDDYLRLPDSQKQAAQYLLLFQMSLGEGQTINNVIDHKQQATVVTLLLDTMPANRLAEIDAQIKQWLNNNLPKQYAYEGVGVGLMFAKIAERNFASMVDGILVAFVIISLLLMLIFRSVKIGLLSLIPNIVPAVVAFGIWGYAVGMIGISLAVVASLTLGIVVDDTVHMLSKYQRARRERGLSPRDAIRYSFRTVGTALTLTSVVLVAGFMLIAQSSYQLTEHMAQMTAITITAALVADFLLLPPLLLLVDRYTKPD